MIETVKTPQWLDYLFASGLPPEPPFRSGGGWRPDRNWWVDFALGMIIAAVTLDALIVICDLRVLHASRP